MRIPYFNTPCILNETCFHGQCTYMKDVLIGVLELCRCHQPYLGYECNETLHLTRFDWLALSSVLLLLLGVLLTLLLVPFLYNLLRNDFYPQIIECSRSRPYIELDDSMTDRRIYRIPSDYVFHRRSILDGLIPLRRLTLNSHSSSRPTTIQNELFQQNQDQTSLNGSIAFRERERFEHGTNRQCHI